MSPSFSKESIVFTIPFLSSNSSISSKTIKNSSLLKVTLTMKKWKKSKKSLKTLPMNLKTMTSTVLMNGTMSGNTLMMLNTLVKLKTKKDKVTES